MPLPQHGENGEPPSSFDQTLQLAYQQRQSDTHKLQPPYSASRTAPSPVFRSERTKSEGAVGSARHGRRGPFHRLGELGSRFLLAGVCLRTPHSRPYGTATPLES